jgi:hypothetical protein
MGYSLLEVIAKSATTKGELRKGLISMQIDIRDIPVYFINLDTHTEKREALEKMLSEQGFKTVIRFNAIRSVDVPRAITASHLEVLKIIKSVGTPAIVLEDDCEIESFQAIIDVPEETDAFYLGKSAWGLGVIDGRLEKYSGNWNSVDYIEGDLYRIRSMYASHAILYTSNEYLDFCIRLCKTALRSGVPHDVYLGAIHSFYNIYTSRFPVFSQSSEHAGSIGPVDSRPNPVG